MPLIDMKDMLHHAHENGYAVGAFDLVSLDFLQGIMTAAEKARAPVILNLVEPLFEAFDFELMMPAVEVAAKRAAIPVAIHLDHGTTLESAVHAINLGCNGVMVDSAQLALPDNISSTRAVVEMARNCGVSVEGDLGYVPGIEGDDAKRHSGDVTYTTLAEAKAYVERTGVDFLAVSIGTIHGHMKGKPKLDWQRLKQINEALAMPLVIHGGSGLSDDQFRRLITHGVAKINYFTALSDVAAKQIKDNTRANTSSGYTKLVNNISHAVATEAERCMRLWGSAGRAAEVLAQCRSWSPVEHLIIYNVKDIDASDIEQIIAEGRQVLSTIPGVREVFSGEAVQDHAKYRYTWLVRFCHSAVIDSYRTHPDYLAFADKLFQPVKGEGISIDYQDLVSMT